MALLAPSPEPSEILMSRTVKDLVIGFDIGFVDRGAPELKGVRWLLGAPRNQGLRQPLSSGRLGVHVAPLASLVAVRLKVERH